MNQYEKHHKFLEKLRGMHEELSSINEQLSRGEQVDETTIDALGELVTDIARIVENAKEQLDDDPDCQHRSDLMHRVSQLETEHPRVTAFLAQVVDLFGMSGI